MKRLYSSAALLFIFLGCFAQEVNIYWGKDNPVDRTSSSYLLGRRGDLLLGYKSSRKNISILKYDFENLQIQGERQVHGKSSSKIGGKVIDSDYSFEDIYLLRNKTYICVTKFDRKSDKYSIYMQEINAEGSLTGSLRKLSEIAANSRRNSGSFNVYTSEDSTKILIVNNPPYEKYSGENFEFKIFDQNLEELHNLAIELPYKDKDFSAEDYILGNDGNIYLLAQISKPKAEKSKDEATYFYEILSINPAGKGQLTEYEINLPGKYITDISYTLQDKKIICSGFYGEVNTKGGIKGIYYMRINKETKAIEATGIKDLDKDFVADLTTRRKADKNRGISSAFKIKSFVRRSDGGALLVSEYSYDYTRTVCTTDPKTGAQSCRTENHYVRNNIIVININPDASIKWYANIPKYQHTVNDGGAFNSYMMATKGSNMYFVYNDNPKNLDPTKAKKGNDMFTMNRPGKSTAVMVEMSEDGNFNKKVLFSNKENKMIIKPKYAVRVSANEQVTSAINYGVYCCFIPFKAAKSKLVRFEFK